jgi:hypothetical protein
MDTQHHDQAPGIAELERKAEELFSLMLPLCEEQISKASHMSDAHASSLAHAAMAVQNTIKAFLALVRIR